MAKVTNIISKPVISVFDCEYVGFVLNVFFDKTTKKIKYIEVLNEVEDLNYILKVNNIVDFENDAVIIKNKDDLELKSNIDLSLQNYSSLINLNCFNKNGKYLGKINEININKNFKIDNINIDNTKIDIKQIRKISKIVLCSENKINFNKYKKQVEFIKPEINYKVNIQNLEAKLPTKAIINEKLLLNRTIYKNIFDSNHKLLFKSNTIINNGIIELAKTNNLLKDLIRYSY